MQKRVVGIDISKDWFDAARPEDQSSLRFENNEKGFKAFLKRFCKPGEKLRICMEATGMLWESLAEYLYKNGHEVVVVNPNVIRDYAGSKMLRTKTDSIDAVLIARYCQENYAQVRLWKPMKRVWKKVKELMRQRQHLVDHSTAEKNRLKAGYTSAETLKSIESHVRYLGDEIERLEGLVKDEIAKDSELSEAVTLVDTIKGIGWVTAVGVLVEIPRVLWDGRLAAVYAGLIPSIKESGKSKRSSYMSRIGSNRARHMLYMPALSAAHSNPVLKAFYQRLLSRGKAKMQALVAVMRKLLHLIFGVLRSGQPFNPEYKRESKAA